jgi:3-hydroxyacyl-CoA dehydrogenase / enoyl-CoA hydratase / 3-hydroxybutyryl-CoA epimerase
MAKETSDPGSPVAPAPARLERDGAGLAWVVLDDPAKRVNTLSSRLLAWFEEALAELEAAPPAGVVVVSGKAEGFAAGADVEELARLSDPDEVVALLLRGHALLGRLEALPCPTVAAIHGACLGGGLELALACRYRVASEHPKTRLGLPEVQLGLIPGLGGTQRLPRRIGLTAALALILTGRPVDPRRALRLGLVDEVCHPHDLRRAALALLRGERRPRGRKPRLAARAADLAARLPFADRLIFDRARKGVLVKTGGHYPAPLVAIEVIREGSRLPLPRALAFEAGAFSRLVVSAAAKNLMSIFFAKNDVESRAARVARGARPLGRVGVLGAGFMGAGIAQGLAYKGVEVVLKDRDLAALGRGLGQIEGLFAALVKRRRYRPLDLKEAMARVHGSVDYAAFRRVDFVVEAVFEELGIKQGVLAELEAVAPAGLIFASNTSTIPIAEIAAKSRRPEHVVGMHFFSPVHKMPLVEVIRHSGSSEEAVATTVELGRRMGKTVIVVGDGPGFFTSRVLGPFVNEAAWCLAEGATVEQIDGAMTRWGWPVGPLALLDEVGLDVVHHAGRVMREHFGDRLAAPPALGRLIEDGRRGRKAGRGFYTYGDGPKRVEGSLYALLDWRHAEVADDEIVERCWLAMLNETARAMEDGVIENPVDVDVGVIFGFGFPPFRGGLLREADRLGLGRVVERLDAYAERYGERLRPAERLRRMAAGGESFYPA